jgi:glutaredoxin 3
MSKRTATLYRMKLPDHECPYGLLAKRMLEDAGFDVGDRLLTSRDDVEDFKAQQGVATTPIIFIEDERIDGSEKLAGYLETAGA